MDKNKLISGLFIFFIGFALVMAKISGEAAAPENAFLFGGFGMVMGGIMFISGLFLPSQKDSQTPVPNVVVNSETKSLVEPALLVICPNCKARVPSKSKFCLECGENLGTGARV